MTREVSLEIAKLLVHKYTRCAVCGIPQYVVARLYLRRWGWPIGKADDNRHLTCDHVDPNGTSDRENLRPLCFGCNHKKHDHLSDEEVLRWARKYWSRMFRRKRMLWWLNTHVEDGRAVGGTLFRSDNMGKIERRVCGEEGETDELRGAGEN